MRRLQALDAAFGVGPPRPAPPWSADVGPLMPMRDRLTAHCRLCLVVLWAAASTLAGALIDRPEVLAVGAVGLVAGLGLSGLAAVIGVELPPELEVARRVPAGTPRRHRSLAWPLLAGGATSVVLVPALLVLASSESELPFLLLPVLLLTLASQSLRQRKLLAEWEEEHHLQVLVPVVGLRHPARRGCYVMPLPGADVEGAPPGQSRQAEPTRR